MAIEYLTGLNAIVMKAIWNIEKRQGRVTIQDLVEEVLFIRKLMNQIIIKCSLSR